MASTPKQERESRARLRAYQARQRVHEMRIARRTRDNWIAAIALVIILVLVVGAQILFFNGGPGTPSPTPSASATPSSSPTPQAGENIGEVPSADLAEGRTWTGTLTLNDVALGVELDGASAPQAVSSTISLAESGFYDGVGCHRLTTGGFFVLQCGDPSGDGTGGPGYSYGPIEAAPADNVYPAGTIAMARSSQNGYSMGSQFFIVYDDTTIPSDSAGGYTIMGKITSGLDELKAQITDAGVQDGKSDGAPVVPTVINGFTLK